MHLQWHFVNNSIYYTSPVSGKPKLLGEVLENGDLKKNKKSTKGEAFGPLFGIKYGLYYAILQHHSTNPINPNLIALLGQMDKNPIISQTILRDLLKIIAGVSELTGKPYNTREILRLHHTAVLLATQAAEVMGLKLPTLRILCTEETPPAFSELLKHPAIRHICEERGIEDHVIDLEIINSDTVDYYGMIHLK